MERNWRTPAGFARDFGLIVVVMLFYFLLRALPPERPEFAAKVTRELIAFERSVHIFLEPGWQSAALEHRFTRDLADALYTYLHFPVLALAGVMAWFHSRRAFELTRDTLFISMVLGLAFYFLLPAAPPRLMASREQVLPSKRQLRISALIAPLPLPSMAMPPPPVA